MPNELAHLGVGGAVTRALIRAADPKWIYAGCVIPDGPWILQRAVHALPCAVDPYSLRLYCITQSSLLFCLVLAAGLAALAQAPKRVFTILALNSLVHLLLDACETKWGNGVDLLAPFFWKPWNLELFWPESLTSYLLTAFGFTYVIVVWWHGRRVPIGVSFTSHRRVATAATLFAAYVFAPLFLMSQPARANSHFLATLRATGHRSGQLLELDRARYVRGEHGDAIITFAGEEIGVAGVTGTRSGSVSVRGVFSDENTMRIDVLHEHWSRIRDSFSQIGLVVVALYWLKPCLDWLRRRFGDSAK
ncbi:MAG: hypothetical protein A2Z18_02415 [Armatimonadetes bacterium RBG_16_58_9]|nr:MAG: hypothetical protein A2Z18_02415 [Armatimonadetes bacterium RBG_16_58_9]